jgi:uncharacterized protein YwgA
MNGWKMDERRIKLAGVLKLFGKSADMSSYDNRLILQKIIYILKCKGVRLDYFFGWYIRGPYSCSLAADGYFLSNEPLTHSPRIAEEEVKTVKEVKEALGEDIKDGKKMEIIASLLFLKNECRFLDDASLVERLKGRKPWLEENEISESLEKLKMICPTVFAP